VRQREIGRKLRPQWQDGVLNVVVCVVQDPFKEEANRGHHTYHQVMTNVFQDSFKAPCHFNPAAKSRWEALHGRVNAHVSALEIEATAILVGSRGNDRSLCIHTRITATDMPEKSRTLVNAVVTLHITVLGWGSVVRVHQTSQTVTLLSA
jgi:hypothetical protein